MTGAPNTVFAQAFPALFGTAYTTKFKVFKPQGKKMEIGVPVAAYPLGLTVPKSKWMIVIDVPVSPFVTQKSLVQKIPDVPVKVAKRPSMTYAEILHVGSYSSEQKSVTLLEAFMHDQRLTIIGPHEEVYLTKPGPKAKTLIRYAVRLPAKRR